MPYSYTDLYGKLTFNANNGSKANVYGFNFQDPPFILEISNIKIAVFHEPDKIENFLKKDSSIELIIHGHTHRYRNENIGNVKIINPGECAGTIKGKNSVGALNLEDLSFERIFF